MRQKRLGYVIVDSHERCTNTSGPTEEECIFNWNIQPCQVQWERACHMGYRCVPVIEEPRKGKGK